MNKTTPARPLPLRALMLRNLIFIIIQPITTAVLIPMLIAGHRRAWITSPWHLWQYAGAIMAIAGTGIFLWSMAELACMGKGTLSFLIPTRRLVREGPYSRSRNPMYAGVTIILLGEALFFLSLPLLIYAAAAWSIFHLLIIPMEERRLVRDFGYAFEYYSQAVRRWI